MPALLYRHHEYRPRNKYEGSKGLSQLWDERQLATIQGLAQECRPSATWPKEAGGTSRGRSQSSLGEPRSASSGNGPPGTTTPQNPTADSSLRSLPRLPTVMLARPGQTLLRRCNPIPPTLRAPSLSSMVQTRSRAKAASLSHEERTATEPRDEGLYTVTIEKVTPVNNRIKTFKFAPREQDTINVSANPPAVLDGH